MPSSSTITIERLPPPWETRPIPGRAAYTLKTIYLGSIYVGMTVDVMKLSDLGDSVPPSPVGEGIIGPIIAWNAEWVEFSFTIPNEGRNAAGMSSLVASIQDVRLGPIDYVFHVVETFLNRHSRYYRQ